MYRPRHTRPGAKWWRWVLGGFSFLLAILLGMGAAGLYIQHQLDSNIERIDDPFKDLTDRPDIVDPGENSNSGPKGDPKNAVNILFLGSDSRTSEGDPSQWEYGRQLADAILLAHIPSDRSGAYVISLPRDSWVEIDGHGEGKLNAAFSYGGMPLMVQTIEKITNVRINHVAIADFNSFAAITDELGGVNITLVKSWGWWKKTYPPGTHLFDGETALHYARHRATLEWGDLDRVKRQQNWMRAMMGQVFNAGILKDPVKLLDLLEVITQNVAVDEDFSINKMRDLALSLANIRPKDVVFLTAKTDRSPDDKGNITRTTLNEEALEELMEAVANDIMAYYVENNRDSLSILGKDVE